MAEFKPGVTIETEEPTIEVTVDPDAPLAVGRHIFSLTVVDDSQNVSEASVVEVIVRDSQNPTAVLDAPQEAEAGRSFVLSGKRSSDVAPGRVVLYQWTLRDQLQ